MILSDDDVWGFGPKHYYTYNAFFFFDWSEKWMSNIININGKFYDFGTKNKSFLITAQELKTLGIKCYYFMLEVKYPHLGVQDIDPNNPDITAEEIAKIHMENKANVWFWLRECAKIPVKGAPKPYPLELHRASCAATWCYQHNIDFLLCQPRQTWKTTIIELLCTYAFIYEFKNVDIPFMHLRERDVVRNAEMFRDYIEALPPYMNPFYNKRRPGTKSIKYEEHNNKVILLSAPDSDVTAKDKMRGMTLFGTFTDEWEYIPYIADVIAGAAPAMNSGRRIAKENHGRACMMYASTPGNLETSEGKAAQHIIDMTPPWSEQYYDFTEEEIAQSFEGVEREDAVGEGKQITMLYIEYNYKQLRKDDAYLKAEYEKAIATGKLAEYRRGVLLERFRGADTVLFDQRDIEYIEKHVRQPDYDIFVLKKFHLYVYKHKVEVVDLTSSTPYFDVNLPYLIGMDIAAGGNGDNTTACVVNPYTLEVVAELSSPFIGPLDLMRLITQLASIIPRGVFCIETNNVGKAIVDFIQESRLESRVYHDPQLDISKNATMTNNDTESMLMKKAKEKYYIGTYVTTKTRNEMFGLLKAHVKDYKHLLNTKFLVKDILNLVMIKGKIQAEIGEHDDMVMGYLHTLYVLYYGKELPRFGIDKRNCSFEKMNQILQEFEDAEAAKEVHNDIPNDGSCPYEEQLLHDITNGASDVPGADEYGYDRNSYGTGYLNNPSSNDSLSASDVAFFSSVNNFY